ncbi:hypothetical protein VTK56DRAFT_8375 [Thermocarpiscus australiensis]
MDGSYGNVFPVSRAISPSTQSSSSNQYKINVNRQKTKKWANFKPQNYDGDDWGADDDEAEDEPQPPPQPRPMGPRHPLAPAPTARLFQPPGTPPLHTLAQRSPAAAAARSAPTEAPVPSLGDSGSGQKEPEQTVSPRSNIRESAVTASSVYSDTPGYAGPVLSPDSRQNSPAPQSAGPLPSQSRSSPRPDQTAKPWIQGRPMSPPRAGSPPALNKPLPIIRPADVYRRMEGEKEKARGLTEFSAPRLQNSANRDGEQTKAPETKGQGVVQIQQAGAIATGGGDAGLGLRPAGGLTPVAERKSEYGIEGLLASYGSEEPHVEPTHLTKASPHSTTAQEHVNSKTQNSVDPAALQTLRRFSTSPQLPDLTRMSGFGEDLFSSSTFLSDSKLQSPHSDGTQLPMQDSAPAVPGESADTADGSSKSLAKPASHIVASVPSSGGALDADLNEPRHGSGVSEATDAAPALAASPPNEPDRRLGLQGGSSAGQEGPSAPGQQPPDTDASQEATSGSKKLTASRPAMPGGWVTETAATPGEVTVPPLVDSSRKTPEKSLELERAPSGIKLDAQPEGSPLYDDRPGQSEPEGMSDIVSDSLRAKGGTPSHPASPHALPPLRIVSPAPTPELEKASRQATSEVEDRVVQASAKIQSSQSTNSIPTSPPKAENSEITPTAPLNPRRGSPEGMTDVQPVVSPPSVGTGSAVDKSGDSPVKMTDVLSEEIIKCLSPAPSAGGSADAAEGSTAAYRAAAGPTRDPTRESNYLGDVYGDYWAVTADKAEPVPVATDRAAVEGEKSAQVISSNPVEAPKPSPVELPANPAGESARSSPKPGDGPGTEPGAATGAGSLRRRFSWEAGPEEPDAAHNPPSTTERSVEQQSLGSGVGTATISTPKPSSPATEPLQMPSGLEGGLSAEEPETKLAAEPDQAATLGMSHALPDATTVRPSSGAGAVTERASPISGSSESQGDANTRLSLADEKMLLQSPVSPSPPLEQHPALLEAQPSRQAVSSGAASPTREAVNILSFRQIMELTSAAERIKHYNEARLQISATGSGLEEWLKAMTSRHPEHGSAGGASGPVAQQNFQGVASNIPMPPQQHGSGGFGHSSNQVGTKSREFLMAAGKAGKGLLSKGRNKLRGTGDKVFSSS